MATVAYPLRIPEEILRLAKLRAKEEYVDQSTAMRQLLYKGAEEYVLHLIEAGRVSIGQGAELLGLSIHDIHRIAEKNGIRLGAIASQQRKSEATMRKLLRG
jgi:hypothetical protein